MSKRYGWTIFAGKIMRPASEERWSGEDIPSTHTILVPSGDEMWWNEVLSMPETETVWQLHVHVGLNPCKNIASAKVCRRQAAGRFRPRHHHPAKPTRDWSWHSVIYNWLYISIFQHVLFRYAHPIICIQNAIKNEPGIMKPENFIKKSSPEMEKNIIFQPQLLL